VRKRAGVFVRTAGGAFRLIDSGIVC
jgi:hypothetical protein